MEECGVKIVHSQPRCPQTGGRYERPHGTLKKKMRTILAENPTMSTKALLDKDLFQCKYVNRKLMQAYPASIRFHLF